MMRVINSMRPFWPIILTISAVAAVAVTLLPAPPALRLLFAGWFLFVCPGMAFVQLANLQEAWLRWLLAVVLSIALDAAAAMIILYTGLWSIERILFIMVVLTLLGAVIQAVEYWRLASHRTVIEEGGQLQQ